MRRRRESYNLAMLKTSGASLSFIKRLLILDLCRLYSVSAILLVCLLIGDRVSLLCSLVVLELVL